MRWVLFYLVVGATLVWLVWGKPLSEGMGGSAPMPPIAAALPAVDDPAPSDRSPSEPPPSEPLRIDPVAANPLPIAPSPTAPSPTATPPAPTGGPAAGWPDTAARGAVEDRGRRLRALARDAEALSLRGRD